MSDKDEELLRAAFRAVYKKSVWDSMRKLCTDAYSLGFSDLGECYAYSALRLATEIQDEAKRAFRQDG